MKKFSYDLVKSWIWWAKIYRKEQVSNEEAVKELEILRSFINSLKNYPR